MNTENKKNHTSIIIVIVIFLVAIVSIFVILRLTKTGSAKVGGDTTTTSSVVDNSYIDEEGNVVTEVATTSAPSNTDVIITTNFEASLKEIITDNLFSGDYSVTIRYSGAKFDFNCTKYDEENDKCLAGSGLMNVGTGLVPLYTYTTDASNYLTHPEDYYIMVSDDYIIIAYNYAGTYAGEAKFYDRAGNYMYTVTDFITGYNENGELVNGLYPNVENGEFNYYSCEGSSVRIQARDMSDKDIITYDEIIEGATCN